MNRFAEHVFKQARVGIQAIPDAIAADIYALSFHYWADEDDPRRAMLTVGYNTTAHWQATIAEASGPDEARWNFAFWLQDEGEACVIGESPADSAARRRWIETARLWFTDDDEDEDFDRCIELGEQIMEQFVAVCITVAKHLHDDGIITGKFGRAIPILVHELEYHEGIAEATRQANPPGLTADFDKWIAAM